MVTDIIFKNAMYKALVEKNGSYRDSNKGKIFMRIILNAITTISNELWMSKHEVLKDLHSTLHYVLKDIDQQVTVPCIGCKRAPECISKYVSINDSNITYLSSQIHECILIDNFLIDYDVPGEQEKKLLKFYGATRIKFKRRNE